MQEDFLVPAGLPHHLWRLLGPEEKLYLKGLEIESHGDHRIAMSMAVAGLIADGATTVGESEAADVSYPTFWGELENARA